MRIDGSLPFHIARAYRASGLSGPALATRAVESQSAAGPQRLVGATVGRAVDFHASPAAASLGAFQLYTRAADKVEAAVAVQVGRTLDLQG
jgi:hypothetical protein